jgi:NADH dehydrogenase (ubiquinone) flavoprotein 1
MDKMMTRFQEGRGHEREIDMLYELTKQVEGHTICALVRVCFQSDAQQDLTI